MATYDKLVTLFETARKNGVSFPEMRLGDYKIKVARKFLPQQLVLYITREDFYVGKIVSSEFISNSAMTLSTATMKEMVKTLSDPLTSAKVYGRKTGNCCVCGRLLTNKHSIKMMIGPICAEKYGFGLFGSLLWEDEDSDSNDIRLEDI